VVAGGPGGHDGFGRTLAAGAAALLGVGAAPHLLLPWYVRRAVRGDERDASLPGDDIVADARTGYTLAITIRATPSAVWPWLVQMGQGRGGFYTHEWVERLLRAGIRNVDRIVPALQRLAVGDTIRLTPDPYLGRRGQFMTVAEVRPEHALVLRQTLPNGTTGTWALVLRAEGHRDTRLLSRRRGTRASLFDRAMAPGYVLMDRGVLRGIRARAEASGVGERSPLGGS